MDAKKEEKGKDTPELVPAPPAPARPSLRGQVAGVPWWLLRGLAKMNHETKAGLVVSASFLCLVGVVLYSKMKEQEQPTVPPAYQQIVKTDADGELHADLPGDPTPDPNPSGKASDGSLSTVNDWHLNDVPGQGVIRTSAIVPAGKDNHATSGQANQQNITTGQLPENGLSSSSTSNQKGKKKGSSPTGDDLELDLNTGANGVGQSTTPSPGGGLGTHKTAPTTVIPPTKTGPQSNTFHLGSENIGATRAHESAGLNGKTVPPKNNNSTTGILGQNHSALDAQHDLAGTPLGHDKDSKAANQAHPKTDPSPDSQASNGLSKTKSRTKNPLAQDAIGPDSAPTAPHAAAPIDLNSAHQMPTGTASGSNLGSFLGSNMGSSKNGLGDAAQAGHGTTLPTKDPKNLFTTTPPKSDLFASTKDPKAAAPPAGPNGQQRIVMPAPDALMGQQSNGALTASQNGHATSVNPLATQPPTKTVDPGVKLGQVVPTPVTGSGLATRPQTPGVALAPLPKSAPPPMQVAQANPLPSSVGRGEFGHSLTPVGASPTVSTAPVAVPMPQSTTPPVTPRVASWDEEMYHFASGDSFDQISQRYYGNPRYAQALLRFNRDRQPAADGLRLEPPVVASGSVIYVPPAKVLEEKYPNVISGDGRSAPTMGASLYQPASGAAGVSHVYKVGTGGDTFLQIAQQTLHDENRWNEIYNLNPRYNPALRIPAGAVLVLPADARIPAANVPG